MSDQPRRDYICPGVDLYLVADANGGWPYATTDRDEAHGRGEAIGGVVGRVNVVGDYRRPAETAVEALGGVEGGSACPEALRGSQGVGAVTLSPAELAEILANVRAAGRREADNAILWNTDCVRCAEHLDRDYAQQARIEQLVRGNASVELIQLAKAMPEHAEGIRHAAHYLGEATTVPSHAIPAYVERVTAS